MITTNENRIAREREKENLPSIQLALNGTPIYLRNLKATVKVSREEQDTSGQASSTARSDKGVKAKELNITGQIPFRNAEWLKTLFLLAEASDKKGEQVEYRIANMTAEAVNMRKGVFSGEVQASQENSQSWNVSFTLKEKESVAEKTAQRKEKPTKQTKTDKKGKVAKPKETAKPKATATATATATKTTTTATKPSGSSAKKSEGFSSTLAGMLGG